METRDCLRSLVERHLTEKSLGRIEDVFSFFADAHFLDACFRVHSPLRDLMAKIVADINAAIDSGDL